MCSRFFDHLSVLIMASEQFCTHVFFADYVSLDEYLEKGAQQVPISELHALSEQNRRHLATYGGFRLRGQPWYRDAINSGG
jgi:hypothetical protein